MQGVRTTPTTSLPDAERSFSFRTVLGDEVATYDGPVETMVEAADAVAKTLGIAIAVFENDEECQADRV